MKAVFNIFNGIVLVIGLWSGIITIMSAYGFKLDGLLLLTAENSWWMLPLCTFVVGIWVGWTARDKALADERDPQRHARKRMHDLILTRIDGLDHKQQNWLWNVYKQGSFTTSPGSDESRLLRGLAAMGLLVESSGAYVDEWFVTPECREAIDIDGRWSEAN